jgi:hypothetical protein
MSEAEYFWPRENEPGLYLVVESGGGFCPIKWDGRSWIASDGSELSHEILKAWGYLGVRREPATPMTEEEEDETEAARETLSMAQQALDEWRACKQQPKAADWAYRWAVDLCERLGAR